MSNLILNRLFMRMSLKA